MRWGMFWRTLLFSLTKCTKVVQVGMLLHNFIIEMREPNDTEDATFFREFDVEMDATQEHITRQSGELPRATVTDNNEPSPSGRPTRDVAEMREAGEECRLNLTTRLAAHAMRRPMEHGMQQNKHGNVCVSY